MADWTQLSPSHSSRDGARVRLLAIHTSEGSTTAAGLANYLADADHQVSYHDVCDDDNTVHCVEYAEKCWALRTGNPVSESFCTTGFAAWSRTQWLAHPGMLERVAAWIAARAEARDIPIVKLTPAQVADGKAGVCGHWDWTVGMKDGSHTDPGSNFPWDLVIARAAELAGWAVDPAPVPTTPPAPKPSGAYAGPYRKGSRDAATPGGPVWRIQDRLKRAYASYAGGLVTDGIYGDKTGVAVAEFQYRSHLTVDRVVGPATWSALKL